MKLKFRSRKHHRNRRLTATDPETGRTLYRVDGPTRGKRPRYRINGVAGLDEATVRTMAEAKCVIREDFADRRKHRTPDAPAPVPLGRPHTARRRWSFSDIDG